MIEEEVVYCPKTNEPCADNCPIKQVVGKWRRTAHGKVSQGLVNRQARYVQESGYWKSQGVLCPTIPTK
ncbi:MAG TPA: hypothetical protein VEW42_06605 [Candidatus Eisenbacteria bacterium]|nr:hypothetical protein [Candidatus Eisenbacteria bacterium]